MTAIVAEAEAALEKLREEAARRELESLLSGEADANDCYLEVHAGAGGTEAQDWAEMLLRMYVRWAEAHGYKVEWLEESAGEGAGHQIGDGPGQRPRRLWLAEDRERRAPAGAHLAVRFERAAPHQLRLGLGLSGGRRQDRDRDQRQGSARSTPTAHRAPAASTSTRPTARCASPIMPSGDRRRSARASARSTRTARTPWRCCAPGSTKLNCRSARRRPTR